MIRHVLLLPFAVGLSWASGSAAAPPSTWHEAAGLRCVVSDSIDVGARIFESPDYQQTLVVPTGGENVFILALRARTYRVVPRESVSWLEDGPAPDLSAGADGGGFMESGGTMTFLDEDHTLAIEPEPPLVGALDLAKLQDSKPDYVYAAERYEPDAKSVASLRAVDRETRIEVFFGAWCSHCKVWVPRLLATLDAAANPHLTPTFYAMDEDLAEPAEPIRRASISDTPTIVVYQGGAELGRIEEEPVTSIESDLAMILAARRP